jgi:hypothetical protein
MLEVVRMKRDESVEFQSLAGSAWQMKVGDGLPGCATSIPSQHSCPSGCNDHGSISHVGIARDRSGAIPIGCLESCNSN